MAARVLGQTRWATWDALPVALALAHGALLLVWPSIPLVAVGLWWNANTISHHFIHRPFFRTRALNAGFSCYLSFLLGFPQSLWRARHLAHHLAIEGRRERHDLKLAALDFAAVIALWGALLVLAPGFMLTVYLPGFLIGLGLCYLQATTNTREVRSVTTAGCITSCCSTMGITSSITRDRRQIGESCLDTEQRRHARAAGQRYCDGWSL